MIKKLPVDSPDRGQVWLVDLGYVAKVRPCLVISIPARNQERALATLVPHTTSSRGSRFEVKVQARFLRDRYNSPCKPFT